MSAAKVLLIAVALLLTGCGREEKYSEMDNKIMCDPTTGKAYYAQPGAGAITFVVPSPNADALCKKGPP